MQFNKQMQLNLLLQEHGYLRVPVEDNLFALKVYNINVNVYLLTHKISFAQITQNPKDTINATPLMKKAKTLR